MTQEQKSNIREYTLPQNTTTLRAGIAWDFLGKPVDLDMSVMVFDNMSFEKEVAFYNNKTICNGNIIHSGDVTDGKEEGDDEFVDINLAKLDESVKSIFFLVNVFEGGTFQNVETGTITLYVNNQSCYNYSLGCAFDNTSFLIGCMSRDDNNSSIWKFKIIEEKGYGKNFDESRPLVEKALKLVYDEVILMERPNNPNTTYKLKKGDIYTFDSKVTQVTIGLGWDPLKSYKSVDVDGSVILLEKDGAKIQFVYYSDKKYKDQVKHSGDNLTGDGDGDDESIFVYLHKMERKVAYIAIVVTIYSGVDSFSKIKNCFVRLINNNGNKELCRYNLSDGDYKETGMIMGYLYRTKNGGWRFTSSGQQAKGRTCKDLYGPVKELCKGAELPSNEVYNESMKAYQNMILNPPRQVTAPISNTSYNSTSNRSGNTTSSSNNNSGGSCCIIL